MMGGRDILIPTNAGTASLDLAIRAIRRRWPMAVFENAETGHVFDDYASLPIGSVRELLAYKTRSDADKWHELGADDALVGTMIHILYRLDGLTLVIDSDPTSEVKSLVAMIQDGLGRGVFAEHRWRSAA